MLTVLSRELVVSFRRGTPYALLTANALVLAALAAAVAAISGTVSPWVAPSIGATASPAQTGLVAALIAWRGPVLFLVLAAWLALLTAFVAPATGARAVTADRADATLEMIVASGVPAGALVVGKWLGASLQVVLVLLGAAPAFALAWLFGGVGIKVAVLTVGLLLAHAGLLVAIGMLAAALMGGELLPTAAAAFAASLLFFVTAAAFVVGLAGGEASLVRFGVANPLLALTAANPELTAALAKGLAVPPSALPIHPSATITGRALGAPLPVVAGLLYAALGLLLLPLVALTLDPYHPLKTARLRRQGLAG